MASSVTLRNAVTAWLAIRIADKLAPSEIEVLVCAFKQIPSDVTSHIKSFDHWTLTLRHKLTDTFHSFEACPDDMKKCCVISEFQGDPSGRYGGYVARPMKIGTIAVQWWFKMQAVAKSLPPPIYDNASQNFVLLLWTKMMQEGMITRQMKERGEQVLLERFGPKLRLKPFILLTSFREGLLVTCEDDSDSSSRSLDLYSELQSL